MRWQGRRKSSNVEDRRGQSPRRGLSGGMLSKGGIGFIIIIVIISLISGENPLNLLMQMQGSGQGPMLTQTTEYTPSAEEEALADFSKVVLADTEDVWNQLLDGYREPTLVLFTGGVQSACGMASSATGPFYCGGDEKLYLDLSFYQELKNKLGAPGDFAQAYVIAHEVGHHVQNLMGITDQVHSMREQLNDADYNKMSVRLELQADFLAGVWAHHAQEMKNILEEGDISEALNAASAIGDDRLQKQSRGFAVPDSFTHGTSAQRMKWFKLGYETGDVSQGDTFNSENL